MPFAQRIYLTRIHDHFDGDKFFPEMEEEEWKEMSAKRHEADSDNPHAYTFYMYGRK